MNKFQEALEKLYTSISLHENAKVRNNFVILIIWCLTLQTYHCRAETLEKLASVNGYKPYYSRSIKDFLTSYTISGHTSHKSLCGAICVAVDQGQWPIINIEIGSLCAILSTKASYFSCLLV